MYWIINEVILFKDNSVGSEPDTDLLDQWGEFVPEIKTVSDILIDPGSVSEALNFLNNNNFLIVQEPADVSDPDEVLLAQWARDGPPITLKPVRNFFLMLWAEVLRGETFKIIKIINIILYRSL